MNRPFDEHDILTHCALRFDGYAYLEQSGFDHQQALEDFFQTGEWNLSPLEAMTTLFTLQRQGGMLMALHEHVFCRFDESVT